MARRGSDEEVQVHEEQILFALKQGTPVSRSRRVPADGISEATYYNWKKRYGNLGLLEVRELRQLRDENARLKRLVADLTLDGTCCRKSLKKRSSHAQTPDIARWIRDCFQLSVRRTCALSCLRKRHVVLPLPSQRQQRLATTAARTGNGQAAIRIRAAAYLLTRRAGGSAATGPSLYKLEGLQVCMRVRRRKRISLHRGPAPTATGGVSTGPWTSSMTSSQTGGSSAC